MVSKRGELKCVKPPEEPVKEESQAKIRTLGKAIVPGTLRILKKAARNETLKRANGNLSPDQKARLPPIIRSGERVIIL